MSTPIGGPLFDHRAEPAQCPGRIGTGAERGDQRRQHRLQRLAAALQDRYAVAREIGAGGMAFLGTLLGILVSSWFLAVPLFVGAGLLTAGITGFCGLARVLAHAPWNRATYNPTGTRTA